MYTPYTATDLVRVMENEMKERHEAGDARRGRLLPATEARTPVSRAVRQRFFAIFARLSGVGSH